MSFDDVLCLCPQGGTLPQKHSQLTVALCAYWLYAVCYGNCCKTKINTFVFIHSLTPY